MCGFFNILHISIMFENNHQNSNESCVLDMLLLAGIHW